MFDSKISHSTLAKEFVVAEKKLHLAVSGRKYDPGKKFPKQKPHDKPDPKKKKRLQRQMGQKQMKWSKFQKTSNLHQKI